MSLIIKLKEEALEEVAEFQCLGTVLCKKETSECEIQDKTVQRRRSNRGVGNVVESRSMSV